MTDPHISPVPIGGMAKYLKWLPGVGQTVWLNMDSGPPLGECIGYLNDPENRRHGYPVILEESGKAVTIAPAFIWPFEPGSPEHLQAEKEGRIG